MFIRKAKFKKLLQEEFERGIEATIKKQLELTSLAKANIADKAVRLVNTKKKEDRKKIAEEILIILKNM